MPPAIAIPIAAALVTTVGAMVTQNVSNKQSAANATNQQNASVANAKTAWQNATNQFNNANASPSPVASAILGGTGNPSAYAPGSPISSPNAPTSATAVPSPSTSAITQQILQALKGGQALPTTAPIMGLTGL